MSKIETAISTVSKMYDTRSAMRAFFGARYHDKIAPFREAIQSRVSAGSQNHVHATLEILEGIPAANRNPISDALLLSACVEMVEPSENT